MLDKSAIQNLSSHFQLPNSPRLSSVICHLSSVICHLSSVICLLSSVFCPLSSVLCHLSSVNQWRLEVGPSWHWHFESSPELDLPVSMRIHWTGANHIPSCRPIAKFDNDCDVFAVRWLLLCGRCAVQGTSRASSGGGRPGSVKHWTWAIGAFEWPGQFHLTYKAAQGR